MVSSPELQYPSSPVLLLHPCSGGQKFSVSDYLWQLQWQQCIPLSLLPEKLILVWYLVAAKRIYGRYSHLECLMHKIRCQSPAPVVRVSSQRKHGIYFLILWMHRKHILCPADPVYGKHDLGMGVGKFLKVLIQGWLCFCLINCFVSKKKRKEKQVFHIISCY